MIRYPITQAHLEAAVDAVSPTWRQRGMARTEAFRIAGRYEEPPAPFWSEIKAVFMRIQRNKCAYCERQLAAVDHGLIEHDVEHFRPKNAVRAWPPINREVPFTYPFPTGSDFPEGYYLLAYNLLNYAVACKPCNSILKSNYFPIAGDRISGQDDPRSLAAEQPLLIYPLGDMDEDPAELIRFTGPIPVPASHDTTTLAYQRARVTIDLFKLDTREELLRERLLIISHLAVVLRGAANGETEMINFIRVFVAANHPRANCMRCFMRLFASDREQAEALADAARRYLLSVCDTTI